jgi:V8-like Glu-specific endopeptidase
MKRTSLLTTLALALASLGSVHADTSRPQSNHPEFGKDLSVDIAAGLSSEAKRAGLAAEIWRWNGIARFEGSDAPDVEATTTSAKSNTMRSASESDTKVAAQQRWIAVNLATGFEYSVDMPRAFAHQIHRYAEQTGTNMGDARGMEKPQAIASALPVAKGWSNGQDTRTRRFDNTSFPFSAMGQMGGGERSGCSGTLIAHNIVLTAAHCLYSRDSEAFYSLAATRFRPGREGECNNASCEPFGEHNAIWYFTPAEYRDNANPWPYDYGIMVVGTSPGNQTGWLGYVAIGDDALEDFCSDHLFGNGRCFNRGYPACGLSGAPGSTTATTSDDCVQGWAYQDVNNCEVGGFGSVAKDGWNSRVAVNCDSSGGHSGSALFTDIWASNKKVVFGVASTHTCSTCGPDDEYPNAYRRISPDVLDAISYFKAAHP